MTVVTETLNLAEDVYFFGGMSIAFDNSTQVEDSQRKAWGMSTISRRNRNDKRFDSLTTQPNEVINNMTRAGVNFTQSTSLLS